MSILLSVLGLAFAAFCVWLAVRIVNRRERWAKRVALGLVVVFVIYPASIGPVAWVKVRVAEPSGPFNDALGVVYMPVLVVGLYGPEPVRQAFQWYGHIWGLEGGD